MDKSAIEKIVELGAPNRISENGYSYVDKELKLIRVPQVKTLAFNTLKGLTDTLIAEIDMFKLPVIVSVSTYNQVEVMTAIDECDRSRETPYTAHAETPSFEFNRYMTYENMIIGLKSKFVETSALNEVVQLLGTITEENNTKLVDDGFTQTVTVKKGIALKENKVINPKVRLTPFRIFLDVKQPESEFLLRLNGCGEVALFEADGGAWKLQARENIAENLDRDLAELIKAELVVIVE